MSRPETPLCEYTIEGHAGGPTLFFIHGWPDDSSLWDAQVAALSDDYRCVRVTLPNFGAAAGKAGGFNFAELAAMLAATIDVARPDSSPVTLVTHDWGAYLGYLLEQAYPARIERIVAMDIGGHIEPGLRERLMIAGYQWTLVLFWLIGGIVPPLGNALTRWFAGKLGVPKARDASVRSRFNYMYFYLWRGMLLPWWGKGLLTNYQPRCPVLYLWGAHKPLMFHSPRWLEMVEQAGGQYASIAGGHWFMQSHADEVNSLTLKWLRR